jgi:hypothetical protein
MNYYRITPLLEKGHSLLVLQDIWAPHNTEYSLNFIYTKFLFISEFQSFLVQLAVALDVYVLKE